MRTPLLLCLGVILLSSCQYQYMTIASDTIPVNNKNEFVVETDTLLITYSFHGLNGPVQVSIYNKSNIGLEIDWKRSSLIIGDKPYNYYKPVMQISGVVENNRRRDNDVTGTITAREGTQFIPPASGISKMEFHLNSP